MERGEIAFYCPRYTRLVRGCWPIVHMMKSALSLSCLRQSNKFQGAPPHMSNTDDISKENPTCQFYRGTLQCDFLLFINAATWFLSTTLCLLLCGRETCLCLLCLWLKIDLLNSMVLIAGICSPKGRVSDPFWESTKMRTVFITWVLNIHLLTSDQRGLARCKIQLWWAESKVRSLPRSGYILQTAQITHLYLVVSASAKKGFC
jgi:hypothetical protein